MALGARTNFHLEILNMIVIYGIYIFTRLFRKARETFVTQPPDTNLQVIAIGLTKENACKRKLIIC